MPAHPPIRLSVFLEMNHSKLIHRNLFEGIALLAAERSNVQVDLWPFDRFYQPNSLSGHSCAGIITHVNEKNRLILAKAKVPVVDVSTGTAKSPFPRVTSDQRWAGQCAASYFLRRGYRNFAYVGYLPHNASRLRLHGYAGELAKAGYRLHDFEFSPADREDISLSSLKEHRRLGTWLRRIPKPLALFCFCDAVANVALRICLAANLSVPDEIAVLGVDNDPMVSRILPVTLSSVDLQMKAIGREAGRVMIDWIRTRCAPPKMTTLRTARIVTRRSTDRFAVSDELVESVLDFIREHISEPMSVEAIARHTNCSRRKLERRFRGSLQMSVYDALLGMRVERACEEIATTGLPLKEIAPLFGFRDTRHMNAVFRRKLGKTSSSFR